MSASVDQRVRDQRLLFGDDRSSNELRYVLAAAALVMRGGNSFLIYDARRRA